jgi:hypothetical protein
VINLFEKGLAEFSPVLAIRNSLNISLAGLTILVCLTPSPTSFA